MMRKRYVKKKEGVYKFIDSIYKYKHKHLCLFGILLIIIFPIIITTDIGLIHFDETCGVIGDTIGGTTAPIIGIISILLLYNTFAEQRKFNKEQYKFNKEQLKFNKEQDKFNKEQELNEYDEQFKSIFFNLLQVQRNIAYSITGTFKNEDNESIVLSGSQFFERCKEDLKKIYCVLDNHNFEEYPEIVSFYNINETIYKEYNAEENEYPIKIANGFLVFYKKHEQIGVYFRHLYHILKFIKNSEDRRLNMIGELPQKQKEEIEYFFKTFSEFVQAQMTQSELTLYFYNCVFFHKAQEQARHFNILENLREKNLILNTHKDCLPGIKLKTGDEIIKDMENGYKI